MEKINIAELLKDYPSGMELYSPIFGDVYLDEIRPYLAVVVRTSDKQKEEFLYDGRFDINGECMLFPSKENRDWSKFQRPFKDGDVVTWEGRGSLVACIYKERKNTTTFNHHFALYKGGLGIVVNGEIALTDGELCLATEEEKQKLFDVIKENGYKWNPKTKTLEKLIVPKFKVGDKIRHKDDKTVITITGRKDDYYFIEFCNIHKKKYQTEKVLFKDQDEFELVPNKFDITTLEPFEKVLVRYGSLSKWNTGFFSHTVKSNNKLYFIVNTQYWEQCIPYKGNEHLRGTTDACSDYFKTWE